MNVLLFTKITITISVILLTIINILMIKVKTEIADSHTNKIEDSWLKLIVEKISSYNCFSELFT